MDELPRMDYHYKGMIEVNTAMTMAGATETGHFTDLLPHLFLSGIQWCKMNFSPCQSYVGKFIYPRPSSPTHALKHQGS